MYATYGVILFPVPAVDLVPFAVLPEDLREASKIALENTQSGYIGCIYMAAGWSV